MTDLSTDKLLGTWDLLSWTRVAGDGTVTYPYGEKAKGRLIYDPSGQMCGFLMDPDYAHIEGVPPRPMVLSYVGHYSLHGDVVHHDIELSSVPNLIGETVRRKASLDGDRMTLTTLTSKGRDDRESHYILKWKKV
ncbi:hypothetical protein GCM10017044_09880 [Kordiimonas sediminis]|uniref:Lipocalin-like domain-containing protein n=1 Tax=Kordiimonas sediminis TaxID=1735581 RepID=A0A919APX0_9PROT|nr:lipocalin-like domain-containing protein [Kordiimonas sediminis]GHF17522.1 hypothetical protein GCM10017044_09880 [Kordiimonas sediminis]